MEVGSKQQTSSGKSSLSSLLLPRHGRLSLPRTRALSLLSLSSSRQSSNPLSENHSGNGSPRLHDPSYSSSPSPKLSLSSSSSKKPLGRARSSQLSDICELDGGRQAMT